MMLVVSLIHLQIKPLDDPQHDARLQRGAIGREQPIKSTCELVIVDLALPDEACIEQLRPLADGIERVAIDQDVLQESEKRVRIAGALQRQRKLLLYPHACDEAVEDRQRSNAQSLELEFLRLHRHP